MIDTDVRVLAATNVEVQEAMKTGRFREDLYYRLNVLSILVPPLRERTAEIPLLFRHFLEKYSEKFGKPSPGPSKHRSDEHTSELQSQSNLVCRLLLEKKTHSRTITAIT